MLHEKPSLIRRRRFTLGQNAIMARTPLAKVLTDVYKEVHGELIEAQIWATLQAAYPGKAKRGQLRKEFGKAVRAVNRLHQARANHPNPHKVGAQ